MRNFTIAALALAGVLLLAGQSPAQRIVVRGSNNAVSVNRGGVVPAGASVARVGVAHNNVALAQAHVGGFNRSFVGARSFGIGSYGYGVGFNRGLYGVGSYNVFPASASYGLGLYGASYGAGLYGAGLYNGIGSYSAASYSIAPPVTYTLPPPQVTYGVQQAYAAPAADVKVEETTTTTYRTYTIPATR